MTLGEELKYNRIQRNISQSRLADMLDVPRSTVWRWERDLNRPSFDYTKKLQEMKLIELDHTN